MGSRTAPCWVRSRAHLRPAITASGPARDGGPAPGLDGRFVEPGPSGAPTRGRPDVLPTGRNFYSVDTRAVPTAGGLASGVAVGRRSLARALSPGARRLADGRSRSPPGAPPACAPAATTSPRRWRSSGCRPVWDTDRTRDGHRGSAARRSSARPRVDVTCASPASSATPFRRRSSSSTMRPRGGCARRAGRGSNPLAARPGDDALRTAQRRARRGGRRAQGDGFRIFGSKPGAYGAGLQALIDERGWEDGGDLAARLSLAWGGYAYGGGVAGPPSTKLFERGSRASRACCTTRTTASTTCSTATTTTSSRAAWRRP